MTHDEHHEHDDELFLQDDVEAAAPNTAPAPLDPWLAALVQDAVHVSERDVPRDLMWARIRQQRRQGTTPVATPVATPVMPLVAAHRPPAASRGFRPQRTLVMRIVAVAATLTVGVAIGRYAFPTPVLPAGAGTSAGTVAVTPGPAASGIAATSAPLPSQSSAQASAPAVVAMEEHLARTVALLTTVRNENPNSGPGADVSGWARELLNTTRLLLDEPQLRDDRTRRLLQDLELVLMQIIQARGTSAPEARRAPSETMRETNLLPRVRAAVTASLTVEESTLRGIAE